VTSLDDWRQSLDDAMQQRGAWPERSPWIRDAVTALPRDIFAPERLYDWDGHAWQPVDRNTDPERWAALLYADQDTAAITHVVDGLPASSLSCQGVVVDMLDSLLLEPGHRVLELGTGNGWNSALLARRTGPGRVTSVEVDPALTKTARRRLPRVGIHTGDGAKGWPAGAPYDRVISTYAVDRIPCAWIEQTRPGGRIVTPWGRLGHVALTVADDGRSATGWVQGLAQFMPARDHLAHTRSYMEIHDTHPPTSERAVQRDLTPLRDDVHLLFALRVALPDLRITTGAEEDGVSAWIHDGHSSWAALNAVAHQGGPRRLADEVEAAWDQWLGLGSPELYDYGLTVTPEEQYAWAVDPQTGPRWPAADVKRVAA
jgi:protein-L-isoaspartate O-methyltransferase